MYVFYLIIYVFNNLLFLKKAQINIKILNFFIKIKKKTFCLTFYIYKV